MRELAKEFHLSFTTIGKIVREDVCQKELEPKNPLHLEHFSYLKIKGVWFKLLWSWT